FLRRGPNGGLSADAARLRAGAHRRDPPGPRAGCRLRRDQGGRSHRPHPAAKMKRRVIAISAIGVAAVLAAGVGMARSTLAKPADSTSPNVPVTRVERGSLELTVHMNGELRASHQQQILAPAVGGALRILSLVDTGAEIKQGNIAVEFDPADQEYALEQAESELLEADQ